MIKKANKGFSLVELSIVILIVEVLIAAVKQGIDLLQDSRLTAARMLTQTSRFASLKGLSLWLETTSENSFSTAESILFDRGLTKKERLSVETYLNKKWKIF